MTVCSPIEFVVPPEHAGTRLDRVAHLAWVAAYPNDGTSRSVMQRWIEEGHVTVDGAIGGAAQKLKRGARLVISPGPSPVTEAVADPSVPFEILYLDDHIVVVDKPAGVVVHPARSHPTGTLVNGLIARGLIPEVEPDLDATDDPIAHERPGIVHRLDKGTSGVMIVARSAVARERLKTLFASHDLDREYTAITIGTTSEATLRSLHGRHPTDRLRFTTRVNQGKQAITHVSIIEPLEGATLVRCRLETGRTHQIRVHLTELARTPILGDPLYGKPPTSPTLRALHDTLGHQALHAGLLALVHPISEKKMRWTSPLPADFAAAYASLRRT